MDDLAEIMKQAQACNLNAEEIMKLVKAASDREDRAVAREIEREKSVREEKEKERLERAEEKEKERLERAREREHELALSQTRGHDSTTTRASNLAQEDPVKPRIPAFSENVEDIDSYILRFEKVAKFHGWKEADYAFHLGTLLRGKALKVYVNLPSQVADNYDSLKLALFKAFQVDAQSYRKQFRSIKAQTEESYVQFLTRLDQIYSRWLALSNVSKTYEGLYDFMIKDQFISSCPPEMQVFLKERKFGDNIELAEAADLYKNARHNPKLYKTHRSEEKTTKDSTQQSQQSGSKYNPKCFLCGKFGHVKAKCPELLNAKENKDVQKHKGSFVHDNSLRPPGCIIDSYGKLNKRKVEVTLDTGCSTVVVNPRVVPRGVKLGSECILYDFLGRPKSFPTAVFNLSSIFFSGEVKAVVAPIKFTDVLLGLVPGVSVPKFTVPKDGKDLYVVDDNLTISGAVTTRSATKKDKGTPLLYNKELNISIDKSAFREAQVNCPTLTSSWEKKRKEQTTTHQGRTVKYDIINGLLYRVCVDSNNPEEKGNKQLVIPQKFRADVMKLAHDGLLAGHFSHRKTSGKIFQSFFWPGAGEDIVRDCRSCEECQKFTNKGRIKPVPLSKMPVVTEPFSKVAIDIVGPISPASSRGHRYILTMIDTATRFPEAVPLKNIDTITVAESLLEIFSRVGIPRQVLSDNGSQFKSDLMTEINRLLSIQAVHSTPYHAASNGCVERLNGTLKSMLKKVCVDHPQEWDRYVPAVLFAYREMPNDSLKFSPFELLYGRNVRGPLSILHEIWANDELDTSIRTSYRHVLELRDRLEDAAKVAKENSKVSANKYKEYFDRKARPRKLSVGDEVLLLLPTDKNKLLMQWRGPYKVVEARSNNVDYVINVRGKHRVYHINMLKKFHKRGIEERVNAVPETREPVEFMLNAVHVGMLEIDKGCSELQEVDIVADEGGSNVNIDDNLSQAQKSDLQAVVEQYPDVLSDIPGKTDRLTHSMTLTSDMPVHKKPYPVPAHLQKVFDEEVDRMLDLGVIEPSSSPYCSPVVLVKKEDSSYRLCIDFRALNDVTRFDSEPMPTRDDDLSEFVNCVYFSEIDLCKGYWQIPLDSASKECTAFSTKKGLMQFTRMPFGLKTACASFVRLMRKVTDGLENISCYFDNIVVHTQDWDSHLKALIKLFDRLRECGLTAGPKKCFLGYQSIKYLGFSLGHNELRPLESRVAAIQNMERPATKSQLRSFMGTINFYRNFIPNLSDISASLTEMLKKSSPNKLRWTTETLEKLKQLQSYLTTDPILKLPDLTRIFFLRTDASDVGLGAVLLQKWDHILMPVCYASRKLLARERNYSTIEKECLAVVWGINHFYRYLCGREFVLQTDHQPLTYIKNMQNDNGRLMRWALALQAYAFTVQYIKGKDNIAADILSRSVG